MEQISNNKPQFFSERKVSIAQVMEVLKKNGIETTEEQTKDILDFLYLLAKTHYDQSAQHTNYDKQQQGDFEHSITASIA
ncbi:hypothetical protein CPT03_07610 [Pedobacter ginsengisoli]|uniref:PTS sugar transporter subunit IIBC n=1 Tax=Pedobacter ginsengisoli TaxID=363852 RepID=A0A2D1U413_9SPHI|nr:hypothetical protein [Pedobacter ginsengisoli]ATP56347.1 hypothetical protein CPT03_07610 [Pedobacter ginsengisoli]